MEQKENLVAKFYKEKLVKIKNREHLFKFKIDLSKINPNKKFEAYYFIDKQDIFWLDETIYNFFKDHFENDTILKYIDSDILNHQIKVYKYTKENIKGYINDEFYDLLNIIICNKRRGVPRKNYKDYNDNLICIREKVDNSFTYFDKIKEHPFLSKFCS